MQFQFFFSSGESGGGAQVHNASRLSEDSLRGSKLNWTTNLSERAIRELSHQEVEQAKSRYTKAVHIMPMWDETRVGFILSHDHVKQAYDTCAKVWRKLKPGQRHTLLEKLGGDLSDEEDHVKNLFLGITNKSKHSVPAQFQYIFYLCSEGAYKELRNPFEIQYHPHPYLGKTIVSLDAAADNLKRTIQSHFEDINYCNVLFHAIDVAINAYEGKTRKNGTDKKKGEPFVIHPIEVTNLLIKVGVRDLNLLVAALFHDLEDAQICNARPIDDTWVRAIEHKIRKEFRDYQRFIDPIKISQIIRDVSKPEVNPDGSPLAESANAKGIMHLNANKTHEGRVAKAGDALSNWPTADVLKLESLGSLIARGPEYVFPFLGKPAENESLTKHQIRIELRLRSMLETLRPQLLRLYSELNPQRWLS